MYTELNNGSVFGGLGYWTLADGKLVLDFSIGFDSSSGTTVYDISQAGETREISESEYWSYIDSCEWIDFVPISDIGA